MRKGLRNLAFSILFLAPACWAVSGCAGGKKIYIPEQANAQSQYKYAMEFRRMCMLTPSENRAMEQYPAVIASYEKVLELYPDDKVHTPLAYLDLGDLHFALKDYKQALRYYDRAIDRYPDMDHIQAYAKLNRGISLESQGDIRRAREMYKECIDLYAGHQRESVQEVVRQAQKLWSRVQTED